MRAVWARSAFDCLHIGLLGFRPDDVGVSFTVLVGSSSDGLAQTETDPVIFRGYGTDVRRFDVKDTVARSFQLESLILAQNERWRQA
jgi:hypothetical protein